MDTVTAFANAMSLPFLDGDLEQTDHTAPNSSSSIINNINNSINNADITNITSISRFAQTSSDEEATSITSAGDISDLDDDDEVVLLCTAHTPHSPRPTPLDLSVTSVGVVPTAEMSPVTPAQAQPHSSVATNTTGVSPVKGSVAVEHMLYLQNFASLYYYSCAGSDDGDGSECDIVF